MPYADLHASTPDVIVCLDGNMQHRQYASVVGDLVLYLDKFSIFVPDSILEGSRQHVLDCQKGNSISSSYRQSSRTPPGVIDTCAASLSRTAPGCVTRHTRHASVTHFRPISGNIVEVTLVTSPNLYINSHAKGTGFPLVRITIMIPL